MQTDILELEFECEGIREDGNFSMDYTGRGKDISPDFRIKNLVSTARTLAVTLEDLSHPVKGFTHWIIWNIPAGSRIPGAIPAGKAVPSMGNARQGIAYGLHRYAGPKPPNGKKHTYRFTVYALDCELTLGAGATKGRFLRKAAGHILQRGSVNGEFGSRCVGS